MGGWGEGARGAKLEQRQCRWVSAASGGGDGRGGLRGGTLWARWRDGYGQRGTSKVAACCGCFFDVFFFFALLREDSSSFCCFAAATCIHWWLSNPNHRDGGDRAKEQQRRAGGGAGGGGGGRRRAGGGPGGGPGCGGGGRRWAAGSAEELCTEKGSCAWARAVAWKRPSQGDARKSTATPRPPPEAQRAPPGGTLVEQHTPARLSAAAPPSLARPPSPQAGPFPTGSPQGDRLPRRPRRPQANRNAWSAGGGRATPRPPCPHPTTFLPSPTGAVPARRQPCRQRGCPYRQARGTSPPKRTADVSRQCINAAWSPQEGGGEAWGTPSRRASYVPPALPTTGHPLPTSPPDPDTPQPYSGGAQKRSSPRCLSSHCFTTARPACTFFMIPTLTS